jgi:hypothetical protein
VNYQYHAIEKFWKSFYRRMLIAIDTNVPLDLADGVDDVVEDGTRGAVAFRIRLESALAICKPFRVVPKLMKTLTQCLCWFTLWLDACLIAGCLSSTWHKTGYAVIGSLTSNTPEGMVSIIVVIVWTTSLAICGLTALRRVGTETLPSFTSMR